LSGVHLNYLPLVRISGGSGNLGDSSYDLLSSIVQLSALTAAVAAAAAALQWGDVQR
jgi:hypothetical protein